MNFRSKHRMQSEQPQYVVQANKNIHLHAGDPLSKMTNKEKQFFLPYLPTSKHSKPTKSEKKSSITQSKALTETDHLSKLSKQV